MYSGYGKAFGGAGFWNFGNKFAKNVVIFVVDNGAWSWMISLVLGEVPTDASNGSFRSRKSLVLVSLKKEKNFARICIIILINSNCLLTEQKYLSLKQIIKMSTLQLSFV